MCVCVCVCVCEVVPSSLSNNEARPNGKGKVVVVLSSKEYVRSGGEAPLILKPDIRWRLVVNFTHRSLCTPR